MSNRQDRDHGERAAPVGELERQAGGEQADRVAGARAGDQVAHGAAAPLARHVVVDQRERRRIAAALAQAGQRVQPERRPEAIGEKHESPRADARGDAGGDVRALRAEMVGDEADDEEREQVSEVKGRLHHAGFARRSVPIPPASAAGPPNRRRTKWPRGAGSSTARRASPAIPLLEECFFLLEADGDPARTERLAEFLEAAGDALAAGLAAHRRRSGGSP